jgi:hypothetical protein
VRGGAESGAGLFIGAERRYLGRGEHAKLVRLLWQFGRRLRRSKCVAATLLMRLVEQRRHAVESELGRGSDERRRVAGGGLQRRCARRRRNGQARVKAASASSGKDASRHGPTRRAALRRAEGRGRGVRPSRAEQRRPACEACERSLWLFLSLEACMP